MPKLGQAPALNRTQWDLWEKFVGEHAGARMAAIIGLTGRLGLRTGEALALQRKDIQNEDEHIEQRWRTQEGD